MTLTSWLDVDRLRHQGSVCQNQKRVLFDCVVPPRHAGFHVPTSLRYLHQPCPRRFLTGWFSARMLPAHALTSYPRIRERVRLRFTDVTSRRRGGTTRSNRTLLLVLTHGTLMAQSVDVEPRGQSHDGHSGRLSGRDESVHSTTPAIPSFFSMPEETSRISQRLFYLPEVEVNREALSLARVGQSRSPSRLANSCERNGLTIDLHLPEGKTVAGKPAKSPPRREKTRYCGGC